MPKKSTLSDQTISIFCEEMAMMLQAGIGPEEAVGLLKEDTQEGPFHEVLSGMEKSMILGGSFAAAVRESGAFPVYAADMIETGETAGRTDQVLRSLSGYYTRQDHLQREIRSAIIYPLSLLLLMSLVLVLMVTVVLPVFTSVYENMAGSLIASSYGYIRFARVLSIVALILIGLTSLAVLGVFIISRTPAGKARVTALLRKLPFTRGPLRQLAVSQFTDVMATFMSSGMDQDTAMEEALPTVTHPELLAEVQAVQAKMQEGEGLAKAITGHHIYPALYERMLLSASRSGRTEEMLQKLAAVTGEDAESEIRGLIAAIEPILTGFLTVSVGLTLLSIMLPLAGMLSAIG